MPKLILVSGRKQSGKNTIGNYLEKTYKYKQFSFAAKLKKETEVFLRRLCGKDYIFDLESEEVKNSVIPYKFNKKKKTVRQFLQYFGTQFFRAFFNDELWAEILCEEMLAFYNKYPKKDIVITDWRFKNESKVVFEKLSSFYDIVTIRVERKKATVMSFFKSLLFEHISEKDLDFYLFDYVIDNIRSIEDLEKKIDDLIKDI